jgi:hypothetical protein
VTEYRTRALATPELGIGGCKEGLLWGIRVDIAMSALSSAILNTGHYHVRPSPSACHLPTPVLQTTGTAAAAPASWLRSISRRVTHVRSPTIQHIDCNKLASGLRPGCWSGFLFDRSLEKVFEGTARPRPPTERSQDKTARGARRSGGRMHRQIRHSARAAKKGTTACRFVQPIEQTTIRAPRRKRRTLR